MKCITGVLTALWRLRGAYLYITEQTTTTTTNRKVFEGYSRMPKKAVDKNFQIRNNLAPVSSSELQCFVIDWNKFTQWLKRAKTKQLSKQQLKRLVTAIKGSVRRGIACDLDDIFFGFNTARKAASVSQKLDLFVHQWNKHIYAKKLFYYCQ